LKKHRGSSPDGLWLVFSSLVLLVTCHLVALHDGVVAPTDPVLITAIVSGYLGLGIGVFLNRLGRYGNRGRAGQREPVAAAALSLPGESATTVRGGIARQMTSAFLAWLEEQRDGEISAWGSFDQLIREMLSEHLSAARVRCYHVPPGSQQLRSLSQSDSSAADTDQATRDAVLVQVAASGREFVAGDPLDGELPDRPASGAEEDWDWVWPVRAASNQGRTVGLVAVGKLPSGTALDRDRCRTIGPLVTLFWEHVRAARRLSIAERIDKGSGVLTRFDFFEIAGRALADSYRHHEPVVVALLALEGLRGLDDVGLWRQRDALVGALGRLVVRRARTDDVVGRFSDDRFVVLLRRLDSGLGRLITEKVVAAAQDYIAQLENAPGPVRVRAGLAGSGFEQPSLETLLAGAAEAVEQARSQDVPLCSESSPQSVVPNPPADVP
jgi:GGDEF domain-containing protein